MEISLENLYVDIGAKRLNVYQHDRRYKPTFRPKVSSQESNVGFTVTLYVISPLHWGTPANTLRSGQDRRTAYT